MDETLGYFEFSVSGGQSPLQYFVNGDSTATTVFDSLPSGIYDILVVDSLGCQVNAEVVINQNSGLTIDSMFVTNVNCNGGMDGFVHVFVEGDDLTYSLDSTINNTGTFDSLSAGIYYISVTNANGCMGGAEVIITEPDSLILTVNIAISSNYIEAFAEGGTSPYMFSIDDKVTFQNTGAFDSLAVGSYTVYVVDANGCEASETILISASEDINSIDLRLFPNPTNNYLNVIGDQNVQISEAYIFNNLGERIANYKNVNSNELIIDVNNLNSGLYTIKLLIDKKYYHYNFMKL